MLKKLRDAIRPSKGSSLARAFLRLGWAGFWVQVVFGSIPIVLTAYFFVFSRTGTVSRSGFPFVEYLTIIDLLILLFTLYWSYRYTRLGRQMLSPDKRPPESTVIRTVWIGVTASTVGMLFSMIVLLIETSNMLFIFLRAPQGGVPMIQTGPEAPYWVSSVDMGSLMALVLTLFAELIVLVLSLWLLFRTTMGSPEFPEAADGKPPEAVPVAGGAAS
jgi:Protein of unknown function (DUF3611)